MPKACEAKDLYAGIIGSVLIDCRCPGRISPYSLLPTPYSLPKPTDNQQLRSVTIQRFHTILEALRAKRDLYVRFETGRGRSLAMAVTPHCLEYSEKDDRFRLEASGHSREWVINLSRLTACEPAHRDAAAPPRPPATARLTFELKNDRKALERVLLHFSHLQKETQRLDEDHYRVILHYDRRDETEMLIRMLSFGPMVRVTEPEPFIELMRRRIARQGEIMEGE